VDKTFFELKDVYFSYLGKIPALCGIDITVSEGQKVAIIGANGCGKSTLLALLDALVFPDSGWIKAFGKEIKECCLDDAGFNLEFRRKVGFLFQNPDTQLFCPTVQEDIAFGPLQLGMSSFEIKERLRTLSEALGIGHLLERAPHQLSVGEKRKVAIASVLAVNPRVLLLDEPTAGLDPQTTRVIIDMLLAESEAGKTIITATHDLHIVEEIADTVYVFASDKRIIRSGSPQDILSDQEFLQNHNLVHIHSHRHKDKTHIHPHLHLEHHPAD
jgi:cobalt/nickel transport system ATP-binding protein